MADTTEAVERLRVHLNAAERQGFSVVNRVDSGDLRLLLSERTALLERVERAEAGNLHPLAEKVWQQSCQGWMDRAQAAETKLATLTVVLEPFMALAKAVTDDGSPDYREWMREAKDWVVAFSFAGQSINLGHLRALAALSQTQEGKTNG